MIDSLNLIEKRLLELEKMINNSEKSGQNKEIEEAYKWWLSMRDRLR
jgi:hypothetical protein